jgi:hypothetical protein
MPYTAQVARSISVVDERCINPRQPALWIGPIRFTGGRWQRGDGRGHQTHRTSVDTFSRGAQRPQGGATFCLVSALNSI